MHITTVIIIESADIYATVYAAVIRLENYL